MIDLINTRAGRAACYAGASSFKDGKYARGGAGSPRRGDEAQGVCENKSSSVQQGEEAPKAGSGMRVLRQKYMFSSMTMDKTGCTICFGYGDTDEPWNPAEMTDDEWAWLWDTVVGCAQGLGIDPASVPIYLVPPGVTRRINADPGGAYGDFIFDKLKGGAPGHWLVVDERGCLTDLNDDEAVQATSKDGEEDFWKARLERQAEYMRYIQQERIDHAEEIAREFAALRGSTQRREAARGLLDGADGIAGELFSAG